VILTAALWTAGALILASAIVWASVHWVKSFGDYAASNRMMAAATLEHAKALQTSNAFLGALHESLQVVAGQNAKLWAEMQHAKSNGHAKGAA
jgi:hypothetical protein